MLHDLGIALVTGAVLGGVLFLAEDDRESRLVERTERLENLRFAREVSIESASGPKPLSGLDFVDAKLAALDLSQADFSNSNLGGAELFRSDLSGATFVGANLQGASLGGADLSGAVLADVNLSNASLRGANLARTDLSGSTISNVDFTSAMITGARLQGACWDPNAPPVGLPPLRLADNAWPDCEVNR